MIRFAWKLILLSSLSFITVIHYAFKENIVTSLNYQLYETGFLGNEIEKKEKISPEFLWNCENYTEIPRVNSENIENIQRPSRGSVHEKFGWQKQFYTKANSSVYIQKAYFDDRPILEGEKYIRMFIEYPEKAYRTVHFSNSTCFLWTQCDEEPIVVPAEERFIKWWLPTRINGTTYFHSVLNCPIPKQYRDFDKLFSHVSFAHEGDYDSLTVYMPVIYPEKPDFPPHEFGVCQSNGAAYGRMGDDKAPWLIEWFEANILFGVTEVTLYNATWQVGDDVQKVLDYYTDLGILNMIQVNPPIPYSDKDTPRLVAEFSQVTSNNDCLYRNMYRYRYILQIDIDEIIVPKEAENYTQMIDTIMDMYYMYDPTYSTFGENKYRKNIMFRGFAFFKDFTDQLLLSLNRVETSKHIYRVADPRKKTFINPETCFVMYSHNCYISLLNYSKNWDYVKPLDIILPESLPRDRFDSMWAPLGQGIVNHYRDTCTSERPTNDSYTSEKCLSLHKRLIFDTRMLHFRAQLEPKVFELRHLILGEKVGNSATRKVETKT